LQQEEERKNPWVEKGAYGLGGEEKRERIAWATSQFKLETFLLPPNAQ
jgi:hypothetical protein